MAAESSRRFTLALASVVGGALLVSGALSAAALIQPPRLVSTDVNPALLVSATGQRMRLHFTQPLTDAAAQSVTIRSIDGEVGATATVDGTDVLVAVDEHLRYDTEYTVEIADVQGRYAGGAGTATTTFTTPVATVVGLDRGAPVGDGRKQRDAIVRRALDDGETETLFTAPYIQSFAVLGRAVAVVTVENDGTNAIRITDGSGRTPERVLLPGDGTVRQAEALDANRLAFSFTSADGSERDALYVFDLSRHEVTPIEGLTGGAMRAPQWGVLGSTGTVLARAEDGALTVLDPDDPAATVPVGNAAGLYDVAPDGSSAIVALRQGQGVLQLATRQSLKLAPPDTSGEVFGGEVIPLGDRLLEWFVLYRGAEYSAALWQRPWGESPARTAEWTKLFDVAEGSIIDTVSTSANGQYAAIETYPDGTDDDGYPINAKPIEGVTVVVDLTDGSIAQTLGLTDLVFTAD